MTHKYKVPILIVAYFAEQTIQKVVSRIPVDLQANYDVEVLIIDDGSTDETFSISLRLDHTGNTQKIIALRNPVNQGYGGNQKIGYRYAIGKNFDFVVLLHGDGQYAPEPMPEILEPLRRNQAEPY